MHPELAKYVDHKKLRSNVRNYPEMVASLTPLQTRRVDVIKRTLLDLPLIHGSRKPLPKGKDLLPCSQLPADQRTNTFAIDRSLGLDNYVFMHWGILVYGHDYGEYFAQTSTSILLSDNTIASEYDIGKLCTSSEIFMAQKRWAKNQIQKDYFDKLVSGKDWLEILARRILKSIESGQKLYTVTKADALGEIKHLGAVPNLAVLARKGPKDMNDQWRCLYQHGLAYDNIEQARTGKIPGHIVPPIDFAAAERYWESVLPR